MTRIRPIQPTVAGLILLATCLTGGCRTHWQQPDRVITALQINPGDRVADIGAGRGYFVFRLADAVGPQGIVYAVEVTDEKVEELTRRVQAKGYSNIEVIRGQFDDPLLPDHGVDLVFCCITYHHIDERPDYFSRLKTDLGDSGRVAILDFKADLTGLAKLLVPKNHATPRQLLLEEMARAGYELLTDHEFLPEQNFIVFAPNKDQAAH